MILFENGHSYRTAIAMAPPAGETLPFIQVRMLGPSGRLVRVVGKLDTGAFRTMLTFAQAAVLGVADPSVGWLAEGTAQAANGQEFPYYVHPVLVRIPNPTGHDLRFDLGAGFAQELQRNLFGVDWLSHLCVAIDERRVHLLRD